MAYVLHNLVLEAMVLAPVEALSDEEPRPNQSGASPKGSAAPKEKAKAKPGPKPKSAGAKAKSKSEKATPKAKAKHDKSHVDETDDVAVNQTPEEKDHAEE